MFELFQKLPVPSVNLSIRARVVLLSVAWMTGLATVAGVSAYSVKTMTDLQSTATTAANLERKAIGAQSLAFELMASERVFMLQPSTERAGKIGDLIARARAAIGELGDEARRLGVATEDAGRLGELATAVAGQFDQLLTKQQRLGMTDDEGLRGDMTRSFGDLRTELNKTTRSGQNPDTVRVAQAFAQINQARAEIMLRHDDVSGGNFNAAVGRFTRELDKTPLDDAAKAKLKTLVTAHSDSLAAYSGAYGEWLRIADQSSLAFDLVGPLTQSIASSADAIDTAAKAKLEAGKAFAILFMLIAIPAAALAGLVVSWRLSRSITRPLVRLRQIMEILASGRPATIEGTERGDEIGAMARTLAVFQESEIAKARLEEEQRQDVARRQSRQQEFDVAVRDFRAAAERLSHSVGSTMAGMSEVAERLLAAATETDNRASNVATAANGASAKVAVVAGAAEELASSIGEISGHVQKTTTVIVSATEGARRTNEQVAALAEAATRVGQVVTMIRTIAEQTNLLALNAAIEAARAGEAGRGFSVVASEVKQLADQTARATAEVANQIADMQASTGEAVTSIRAIAAIMEDVNTATLNIASAVEEQEASTTEISRSVTEAASNTQTVTQNVGHVVEAIGTTAETARLVEAAADTVMSETRELERVIEAFLNRVAA
jgi:methyl-accepting chemotaxis protein